MNLIIIAAVAVVIVAVFLMIKISKPKSSDDDMAEYSKSKGDKKEFSKPSLKKGFQEEASVKCMVANATCSRLKYMDFKGDVYDVKYDGKNVNIERETEKDDTLKDYKIEKAYMQGGFSLIEGNETAERINNFNQNMKHIRIYDKDDNDYKSITFKQGINDFVDKIGRASCRERV